MKLHGESLTMPEPDDAGENTGGGAGLVALLLLLLAGACAFLVFAGMAAG